MSSFANNFKSTMLLLLFTTGKHLRQLTIFPKVDIRGNFHPKVSACNTKRTCKKLHRPQLAMINVNPEQGD